MDWSEIAAMIVAITGMITAVSAFVWQGAKYVKAQGRIEALHEQGEETIKAKNEQISRMKAKQVEQEKQAQERIRKAEEERDKLWHLLDGITR